MFASSSRPCRVPSSPLSPCMTTTAQSIRAASTSSVRWKRPFPGRWEISAPLPAVRSRLTRSMPFPSGLNRM